LKLCVKDPSGVKNIKEKGNPYCTARFPDPEERNFFIIQMTKEMNIIRTHGIKSELLRTHVLNSSRRFGK